MDCKEKTITLPLSRIKLAYKEWRSDKTPCIVALHGWLDNAASFDPLALLLQDYRLLAFDLPGHGFSEHRPPGAGYSFLEYVQDLWEIQEALQLTSYILMGHSLGAGIASFFTGVFPEKVRRLILVEGLGAVPGENQDIGGRFRHYLSLRSALQKKQPPRYPDIDTALRMRLKATTMAPTSARLIVERGLKPVDESFVWRSDSRLTLPSPFRLTEEQNKGVLKNISCPTFFVLASDGLVREAAPFQVSHRFAYIPHLEMTEISGHHHVHMDSPAVVAEKIKNFLSQKSSE